MSEAPLYRVYPQTFVNTRDLATALLALPEADEEAWGISLSFALSRSLFKLPFKRP